MLVLSRSPSVVFLFVSISALEVFVTIDMFLTTKLDVVMTADAGDDVSVECNVQC